MCHRSNKDQASDVQIKYKTPYYCDPLQGAFMINPHQERVLIFISLCPRRTGMSVLLSGVTEMPL